MSLGVCYFFPKWQPEYPINQLNGETVAYIQVVSKLFVAGATAIIDSTAVNSRVVLLRRV